MDINKDNYNQNTTSILVQLFYPMDEKKEITMEDVDKAYQKILDDLSGVLDNLTEREWKILQIITSIGKKLKKNKKLDITEVTLLIGELQKMNVINLDRMQNLKDIEDMEV